MVIETAPDRVWPGKACIGVCILQGPHNKYAMHSDTSHPFDVDYPKNPLSGTASTVIIDTSGR